MPARAKGSAADGGVVGAASQEPAAASQAAAPCIVGARARGSALAPRCATAFPRRRARVLLVRDGSELSESIRTTLVDAVIVDLGAGGEEPDRAARARARVPEPPVRRDRSAARRRRSGARGGARPTSSPTSLIEGVDDGVLRALLAPIMFSSRFARALWNPPPALGLGAPLQQAAWRSVVARGGRPVRTSELAATLGVTREHLSRSLRRGRRAEPEARHRPRPAARRRGAEQEPGLRRARRRARARLRVRVPPLEHRAAHRRDEARVAGAAARGGPGGPLRSGARAEPGRRPLTGCVSAARPARCAPPRHPLRPVGRDR